MPLYDFECLVCGERFEAQVAESERPACSVCGAADVRRLLSPFSGPFTTGLRGLAARRSNATRRTREERRRDQSIKRREQRDGG